jgi:hypothetical protein
MDPPVPVDVIEGKLVVNVFVYIVVAAYGADVAMFCMVTNASAP